MSTKIKTTELSIKDTFNIAFSIFINNFKFLLVFALLMYVPLGLIFIIVPQEIMGNGYLSFDDPAFTQELFALVFTLLASLMVFAIIIPIIYAGITGLVSHAVEDNEPSFKPIVESTYKKLGKLIATTILFHLIIAPMLILILPGIYFGILFIFFPFVIAITDKWGFKAFAESRRIIKGRWFKTLSFLFLTSLFLAMTSNLARGVQSTFFVFLGNNPISFLLYFVFIEFINMYFRVVVSLWFLNKYYLLQEEIRGA